MTKELECPRCGNTWITEKDPLGNVERRGYTKVSDGKGQCKNCGNVHAF